MSQEEQNVQQNGDYQDPLQENGGKPAKKTGNASVIGSTIVSVIVWRVFGLLGGLICFGGFWAVCGIAKSKLPLAARIILCILTAIIFLVLLFVFILLSAAVLE